MQINQNAWARRSFLFPAVFALVSVSSYAMADIAGNSNCDPGVAPNRSFGGNPIGKGNTCDLFENDANQKAQEFSELVTNGNGMVPRWLVVLEKGDPKNQRDREMVANWSDVVLIFNSTTLQLFSDSGTPEKFDPNNVKVPKGPGPFTSNSATAANIINGKYTSQNTLTNQTLTLGLSGKTDYALEAVATKANADPPTTFTEANTLVGQGGRPAAPPDKFNIFSDPGPVPPAQPKEPAPAPRGGAKDPMITFNAATGSLSISDGVVDFLNLAGDETLLSPFSSDPLLGATERITGLTLSGPDGHGFLFENGLLTIFNGQETFLSAYIPELLIDDSASGLGANVFAPLGITSIDSLASPFLSDYDATWVETSLTPELFGSTARPVTDLIGANQSFAVKFNGESIGFAVPEPGSGVLFATGLVALGAFLRWSRQAESDVRFFAGIDWGDRDTSGLPYRGFAQCRVYSKYLGLQIKACDAGLPRVCAALDAPSSWSADSNS
jgi:hypothetical protein